VSGKAILIDLNLTASRMARGCPGHSPQSAQGDYRAAPLEATAKGAVYCGPKTWRSASGLRSEIRLLGVNSPVEGIWQRYGGVICPAAWRAAQWGRTSTSR
jgi:hypothetical protein